MCIIPIRTSFISNAKIKKKNNHNNVLISFINGRCTCYAVIKGINDPVLYQKNEVRVVTEIRFRRLIDVKFVVNSTMFQVLLPVHSDISITETASRTADIASIALIDIRSPIGCNLEYPILGLVPLAGTSAAGRL